MIELSNYRDLGLLNGWPYLSDESREEHEAVLDACREKGHFTRTREVNRYTDCEYCPICEYKYNVDTGD